MKYVIFNEIYNTKLLSAAGMETMMQARLDRWLGPGKVSVKVELSGEKNEIMDLTLFRSYGPWYEDPRRWSGFNECIYGWDKQIFLAEGYQEGSAADFENNTCPYRIYEDVQTMFLPDLKDMAKKHHASRIESVAVDNYIDHITLTIKLKTR